MIINTTIRNGTVATAAMGLCLLSLNTTALAQKSISLTAVDGYPPKALQVKTFLSYFIPEVDKRLAKSGQYKIRWNKAFSGQIVKVRHVMTGMQKGLGDIGIVTSVFHQDKVPMQAIAYVAPFVTSDPVLLSRAVDELANEFPEMKNAWLKYNQVLLTSFSVIDSYQMFFAKKITKVEDFKDLKIAGAGINMRYLTGTGATPVIGSMVHYYNQFKTGAIDGSMLWTDAAVAFKLVEGAKYMLKADIGTANSKALTMNLDAYKRLPKSVRDVIHAVAYDYRDYTAQQAKNDAAKSYENFKKKGGIIIQMSDAARAGWANSMPNIGKDWAAKLDKEGLPGTKLLSAYMTKMRAANQPIIRQWDKE
ncbi:MAG: C4-dicarboxylate TRAP transporter substrate-binding protein [Proteobacteria bacterium]|nr:C4-dicarboxylate TRAP transporter substrate-binding protein [Pseudomonadota bacterium]